LAQAFEIHAAFRKLIVYDQQIMRQRFNLVFTVAAIVMISSFFAPVVNASTSDHLFSYSVQGSDTLYSIGMKYEVAWQSIATENHIRSPYVISIGEQLLIPVTSGAITYSVKPNDTLTSIGQYFEVSWPVIAQTNGISTPYTLYVGENLLIPLVNPTCSYQSSGGADGSGYWCWSASTSALRNQSLSASLSGAANYFGVCAKTLEQDNGYRINASIWNGEEIAIPNGSSCPMATESWVWLWENYDSGLSTIQQNPGAITVVSPNIYYLFDNGTFGIQYTQAEVCPQVHALHLKCVPVIQNDQENPAGINTLLSSSALQSKFIQCAVSAAVSSKLNGYNVDFEPSSGILNLAPQYGTFLTNFANAMHAKGKTLSVDVASWDGGALWNLTIEAQSSVNLVLTMTTYDSSYSTFEQGLNAMLASVPIQKIAIGLITVSDDSTLSQRIQAIESTDVHCVMVWPSYPGFLSNTWFGNLTSYETNY
jgi:spore germination protein YaaH